MAEGRQNRKQGGERKAKTPEQALAALMRLAARSEKSSGDALRLMRTWGVDPTRQQGVLDKLIEQKFIDDRRYAEAYVREKSRLNGWGTYKIRSMLAAKGIAKELIESALSQVEKTASRDRLAEMMERKMKTTKADDPYKLKGKLLRYGLSLGYEYEDVMQAVEKIVE